MKLKFQSQFAVLSTLPKMLRSRFDYLNDGRNSGKRVRIVTVVILRVTFPLCLTQVGI